MALTSPQTAIAIVPPPHLRSQISTFRELYDKAYMKWPAHINLLYPFVARTELAEAVAKLGAALELRQRHGLLPFRITLNRHGTFEHKKSVTHFLGPDEASIETLKDLRQYLLDVLGKGEETKTTDIPSERGYNPHLTLGQTSLGFESLDSVLFQVEELAKLSLSWEVFTLAVLERGDNGEMTITSELSLGADEHKVPIEVETTQEPRGLKRCFVFKHPIEEWVVDEAGHMDTPTVMPQQWNVATHDVTYYYRGSERFSLLIKAIESIPPQQSIPTAPAVLCLQGVTKDLLIHLLSQSEIRKRYPYSSHAPNTVSQNNRDCVIMATTSFDWEYLSVRTSGEVKMIVATFPGLAIANVCLSLYDRCSNFNTATEITALTNYLEKHSPNEPWLVAGGFNMPAFSDGMDTANNIDMVHANVLEAFSNNHVFADVWDLADEEKMFPHGEVKQDDSSSEFDRGASGRAQCCQHVLLNRSGELAVQEVGKFGFPTGEGTNSSMRIDYGIYAKLNCIHSNQLSSAVQKIPTLTDPTDLQRFLDDDLPTFKDRLDRKQALLHLKECIETHTDAVTGDASTTSGTRILLAPLGSYALDVCSKDAALDCLCVSTMSPKTFFQLARQRIRKAGNQGGRRIQILNFSEDIVLMLEVLVHQVKINLLYTQAPALMLRWNEAPLLPRKHPIFDLLPASLKTLNAYRDTQFLLRTVPNLNAFRKAHRFLQTALKNAGLWSPRFGFVGGQLLTLLLSRVSKLADKNHTRITGAELIRLFFAYYSAFEFDKDVVVDPSMEDSKSQFRRSKLQAMVVLGIHMPNTKLNVAISVTKHNLTTLITYFKDASHLLERGEWKALVAAKTEYVDAFLKKHQSFIKIEYQSWDQAKVNFRRLTRAIEERVPSLLNELETRLPQIHTRIWPERFHETAANEGESVIRGFYLIGLSPASDSITKLSKAEANNRLLGALRRWEEGLKSTSLYDPASSWLEVSQVHSASLIDVDVDARDLGYEEMDSVSDDDEEPDESEQQTLPSRHSTPRPHSPTNNPASGKLRPAHHVLSRLRHDSALDIADYVIGYEDRFLGTREMAVDRWKTEQTEEEFIPLHRVVYFRRRSDGVVVWDRERKIDLVFGS